MSENEEKRDTRYTTGYGACLDPFRDINWSAITNAKSANNIFEFKHHSTSSTIELVMKLDDGTKNTFWMDYCEFEELCIFLKKLKLMK